MTAKKQTKKEKKNDKKKNKKTVVDENKWKNLKMSKMKCSQLSVFNRP